MLGIYEPTCNEIPALSFSIVIKHREQKISNETQASHILFLTLLVMLGNYEPTCIVTLIIVTM